MDELLLIKLVAIYCLVFILMDTKREKFGTCINTDKIQKDLDGLSDKIFDPIKNSVGKMVGEVFGKLGSVWDTFTDEVKKAAGKTWSTIDSAYPLLKFGPLVVGLLLILGIISPLLIILILIKLITGSWIAGVVIFAVLFGGVAFFFKAFIDQLLGGLGYIFRNIPIFDAFSKAIAKLGIKFDFPNIGKIIFEPIFKVICMIIDGIEKAINGVGNGIESVVNSAIINPVNSLIGHISAKKVGKKWKVGPYKFGFDIQVTPKINKLGELNVKDVDIKI